uniref:CIDE-N domain-containing protein n=1 Tax=Podarcis muralis TaxID=64176 RepID=A0A670KAD2_PODMU
MGNQLRNQHLMDSIHPFRCVSANAPQARPYRVSNCDRTVRKGIMADSLRDLHEKVRSALLLAGNISIVLDEDGTTVETEEFFQTLEDGTVLLVLTKGQTWLCGLTHSATCPRRRIDVACVTFDLYKTDPRDFIGCLNVKATLYGTYSMSYDVQCYGAKRIMIPTFLIHTSGTEMCGPKCDLSAKFTLFVVLSSSQAMCKKKKRKSI